MSQTKPKQEEHHEDIEVEQISSVCSSSSQSQPLSIIVETPDPKESRKSQCVTFVFGILPFLVMLGIFIVFSLNDSLKLSVISIFKHLKSTGINFTITCHLLVYAALLVFVSFPYVIFEMSLGFTFPPMEAMLLAVCGKLIGEVMCFVLSRYLLKSCFLKFLRMNEHFQVIETAVKKYPWTVSNLMRASILVPLFVINFGSGIVDLTFTQYIVPALLWGTLYSGFSVLCGSQLENISEVIENAAYPKNPLLFIFELSMLVLSLAIIVAAIIKSRQIYDSIKAEMIEEENEKATQIVYSTKGESFAESTKPNYLSNNRYRTTSLLDEDDFANSNTSNTYHDSYQVVTEFAKHGTNKLINNNNNINHNQVDVPNYKAKHEFYTSQFDAIDINQNDLEDNLDVEMQTIKTFKPHHWNEVTV